jgi:hypothetical protein
MKIALILVGSLLAGLILLYLTLRTVFAWIRRRLRRKLRETFDPDDIIRATVRANFFGLKSRGVQQTRGNAALVLTTETLWSCLGLPQREMKIPLRQVRKVSLVKSHCGRSVFVDLLRVDYLSDHGDDAAAWYVPRAERWLKDIDTLRGTPATSLRTKRNRPPSSDPDHGIVDQV